MIRGGIRVRQEGGNIGEVSQAQRRKTWLIKLKICIHEQTPNNLNETKYCI